ncbi:inorganic triphosphatase [Alkalimarinus sediminis]|uniref:CYTH domain-containing protein n=1 Tax=Alkalimarinus sediminis TaxID=1632866 RepID=A0A9E8HJF2_9ALTE|nr:CYTH domain-containing protein [Alkalimarinus sediminis]UZW75460.1 CYTH domain-containing protein [Alkalimarinus sediminis]
MSKEIELKMIASPVSVKSGLPELLKKLDVKKVKETWLVNKYFDTHDLLLNKACIALRIREKGGRFIQTLKTKGDTVGGLSQRGEWEWGLSGCKLDVTCLHEGGWPEGIPVAELAEVFETNFKRTSAVVELKGGRAELAVDDGYILAGGVKSPLSEVEIELIDGDAGVLFEVAEIVAHAMSVMVADVSKAEKGYRLVSGGEMKAFSYPLGCVSDSKSVIKELVSRNLSHWLFLVDQFEVRHARLSILELVGVLTTLREVVGIYRSIDGLNDFSYFELFDLEINALGALLDEVVANDCLCDVGRLLSSGRAGVLSVELSRWLRTL